MKRILAIVLALAVLCCLLGGCASISRDPVESVPAESTVPTAEPALAPEAETPQETSAVEAAPEPEKPVITIEYPIEGDYELTYFFPGSRGRGFTNPGEDCLVHQKMAEITGVNMKYTSFAADAATEQYNLMIASGDYTDLITGGTPTNGYEYAIEEGIYLRLNELMQENAPDYWALLTADESVYKGASTDTGNQYGFMMLFDQPAGSNSSMVCRADWLKELNMEVPTDVEGFSRMLDAFHTNYDCSATWYIDSTLFSAGAAVSGAYNVYNGWMVKDGTELLYGYLQPGLKEYVELLRGYYEAGYISSDFTTITRAIPPNTDLIYNNQVGVFAEFYNSVTSNVIQGSDLIEGFDLCAVPKLKLNAETPMDYMDLSVSFNAGENTAISTACENPEIACRWLNYFYTEPGIILTNYGVEGVSYTVAEDGSYEFTELMLNNPEGKNFTTCLESYCMYTGTMYRFFERDMTACKPYDREAYNVWNSFTGPATYTSAPTLSLTAEESERVGSDFTDITTYLSEQLPNFVTGELDMSQWDEMLVTIDSMGMDSVLEVYNEAFVRYNNR